MEPIYLTMIWVRLREFGERITLLPCWLISILTDTGVWSKSEKIAHHWISTFTFFGIIWCAA